MRILVVEPHPDDAFLSLGWHLEHLWKNDERCILTVYADAKRTKEAEAYAKAIGARSEVIGLEESKMNGGKRVTEVVELAEYLEELENQHWDKIFFPVGLQHPDHLSVAATRLPGCYRYLDTPYQTKQKLAEILLEKVEGWTVDSILFPSSRKWRHEEVFKSQSRFFYYNSKLKESLLPEIVFAPVT